MSAPTEGSNYTVFPLGSPIIPESQLLPVCPAPKIQTMLSGLTPVSRTLLLSTLARSPAVFERYHLHLEERGQAIYLRTFVLDGAGAKFPEVAGPDDYLAIKEPGGSVRASLLMEALPESRMILLVREPRGVVASWIDAHGEGGWRPARDRRIPIEGDEGDEEVPTARGRGQAGVRRRCG